MRTHLLNADAQLTACGRQAPKCESDILRVDCGLCARTRRFGQLAARRQRRLERWQPYFTEQQQLVFEGFVQTWDPRQQRCRMSGLQTLNQPEGPRLPQADFHGWEIPVPPGQRIWLIARCLQLQSPLPSLVFTRLLHLFGPLPEHLAFLKWHWTGHARQRLDQRRIPEYLVYLALNHGPAYRQGQGLAHHLPSCGDELAEYRPWRRLRVITSGRKIVTLYLN